MQVCPAAHRISVHVWTDKPVASIPKPILSNLLLNKAQVWFICDHKIALTLWCTSTPLLFNLRFFFFFLPSKCHKRHSGYNWKWTTEASFTILSAHILNLYTCGGKKKSSELCGTWQWFFPLHKIKFVCDIEGCCKTDTQMSKYYFRVLFLSIELAINDKEQVNSGTI